MAALKEPVKMFIVQSLACFETPQQVADAVMQRFGIEIDRRQCENYDPTKFAGRNLSKKLKDLFHQARNDFRTNVFDIPLANKAVRLKELQNIYNDPKVNRILKTKLIKQFKDEMHGYEIQILDIQLKQLEIERIKTGDGDGADDPTPVKVTIQVVDASKQDAEYQPDAERASGKLSTTSE
ncbi:DUF2280 domain-containing protein [Acinetobacter bereziniae]|uniref:DUF2280 domain-containing protein n=1 Tax=Acinetobacter bereziniae TaxID=106648 RepID=UPI003212A521